MTNKASDAFTRAVRLLDRGEYASAIAACGDAITLDRDNAAAFCLRAVAYRAKGEHARAAADFERATMLAPTGAIAAVREALRWELREATAFFNRANAYHNEGDYTRAINNYSHAVKLDPKHAAAFLNRAVAFQSRDQNNPAKSGYDDRFGGVPDCYRAIDDYRMVLRLDADANAKGLAHAGIARLTAAMPPVPRRR